MTKLPNHTALKEWASVIDALGRGTQVVLIRKGGIADPTFGVEAQRFYLFPTNYHDAGKGEPADVPITHWAEVVRTWRIADLERLHRLEPMVGFDRPSLDIRYRFRPDQALHVLGIRTWKLAHPQSIAMQPSYGGCKSWVSLDDEIDIDGSMEALSESDLQSRLSEVDQLLCEPAAKVVFRD